MTSQEQASEKETSEKTPATAQKPRFSGAGAEPAQLLPPVTRGGPGFSGRGRGFGFRNNAQVASGATDDETTAPTVRGFGGFGSRAPTRGGGAPGSADSNPKAALFAAHRAAQREQRSTAASAAAPKPDDPAMCFPNGPYQVAPPSVYDVLLSHMRLRHVLYDATTDNLFALWCRQVGMNRPSYDSDDFLVHRLPSTHPNGGGLPEQRLSLGNNANLEGVNQALREHPALHHVMSGAEFRATVAPNGDVVLTRPATTEPFGAPRMSHRDAPPVPVFTLVIMPRLAFDVSGIKVVTVSRIPPRSETTWRAVPFTTTSDTASERVGLILASERNAMDGRGIDRRPVILVVSYAGSEATSEATVHQEFRVNIQGVPDTTTSTSDGIATLTRAMCNCIGFMQQNADTVEFLYAVQDSTGSYNLEMQKFNLHGVVVSTGPLSAMTATGPVSLTTRMRCALTYAWPNVVQCGTGSSLLACSKTGMSKDLSITILHADPGESLCTYASNHAVTNVEFTALSGLCWGGGVLHVAYEEVNKARDSMRSGHFLARLFVRHVSRRHDTWHDYCRDAWHSTCTGGFAAAWECSSGD